MKRGPYLEFKKPNEFMVQDKFSWDRFSEELAETVSAFLNSDGGVLLIGVQTDRVAADKRAERLKQHGEWVSNQTLEHVGIKLTPSQIGDRIYGNILPKPFGIEVNSIDVQLKEGATRIFVITVPTSDTGAHQSLRMGLSDGWLVTGSLDPATGNNSGAAYVFPVARRPTNLADFADFQICLTGDRGGVRFSCGNFDFDDDADIDLEDYACLLPSLVGP